MRRSGQKSQGPRRTAGRSGPRLRQARGKRVDRRADIWSFGVVVWEMLTGERLFAGETVSDTLAAVLRADIDLSRLPADTPASLRWVLERCLERDPRTRLRDIGEARLAIERGPHSAREITQPPRVRPRRERIAWALCAILVIALAGVVWQLGHPRSSSSPFIARLSLLDDATLPNDGGSSVVISHNGRMIVLVGADKAGTQLYLNRSDRLGTPPIPGTRGASNPFFSPDDQWIGFFANGKLQKVATSGGAPVMLCDVPVSRGGAWGEGGRIVFAPGVETGLFVVSENGGTPEELTRPDPSRKERSHRWPAFLPGGKAVLYSAQSNGKKYEDGTIQVVSLEDKTTRIVNSGGSYPQWADRGHILYARQGALFAIPFDPDRLKTAGPATPVVQELLASTENEASCDGSAQFSLSATGTLVYRRGVASSGKNRIAVVGRGPRGETIAVSPPGSYSAPTISTAGLVAVHASNETRSDIWIWDFRNNGSMTRLTFDGTANGVPVWSPDGTRIAHGQKYLAGDNARLLTDPFVKNADGSGMDRPLSPGSQGLFQFGFLTSWGTPRTLLYGNNPNGEGMTIYALHLQPDGSAIPSEPLFPGEGGDISPDGRWIAYHVRQAGDGWQVMVRPVDGGGEQYQVSTAGGRFPHWTRGGSEIVWDDARGGSSRRSGIRSTRNT